MKRKRNKVELPPSVNPFIRNAANPDLRVNVWRPAASDPVSRAARDAAIRQRLGGMLLRDLPAEIKTVASDVRYQPWRVTLWIQDNQFSPALRPVSYFVRGPEAEHAVMQVAAPLWERWELKDLGYPESSEYPCIGDQTFIESVVLDEKDWSNYVKDALRYGQSNGLTYHAIGAPRHPFFWTVPGLVFDVAGCPVVNPKPHRAYPPVPQAAAHEPDGPDWTIGLEPKE